MRYVRVTAMVSTPWLYEERAGHTSEHNVQRMTQRLIRGKDRPHSHLSLG
jgi:hypothetical protein